MSAGLTWVTPGGPDSKAKVPELLRIGLPAEPVYTDKGLYLAPGCDICGANCSHGDSKIMLWFYGFVCLFVLGCFLVLFC